MRQDCTTHGLASIAVDDVKHEDSARESWPAAAAAAAPYHAALPPEARRALLRRFLDESIRIMVATNAFGMGIDKPDMRLVLHLGIPSRPEAYYQEAGRAGRDGAPPSVRIGGCSGRHGAPRHG
jgi:ATP-dependent DNA helicase RecQ